jgi:hypothetical protein
MHRLMYIVRSSALHPSIHVHCSSRGSKVTKSLAQGLHEKCTNKEFSI